MNNKWGLNFSITHSHTRRHQFAKTLYKYKEKRLHYKAHTLAPVCWLAKWGLNFPSQTLTHTGTSLLKFYIHTKRNACIVKLTHWHWFVYWPYGAIIFHHIVTHTGTSLLKILYRLNSVGTYLKLFEFKSCF